MIKDIVVNLGLGAHDPACDYAISVGKASRRTSLASLCPTSRSFPAP